MSKTHLILSGGGTRGICSLGIIKHLCDNNILNDIKYILGISIGALIGLLLCVTDIGDIIDNLLKQLFCLSEDDIDINLLFKNFSLISKNKFISILEQILFEKTNINNITFLKLYNISKIELTITVANISTSSIEYINYKTNPELTIAQAIRCAINIPMLFEKEIMNECLYADCGIYTNFIWNFYKIEDKFKIGIYIENIFTIHDLDTMNLSHYISVICNSIFKHINSIHDIIYNNDILCVKEDIPFLDFHFNQEIVSKYIQIGINIAQNYIKNKDGI